MLTTVELFEHETVRVGTTLRTVGGGSHVLTEEELSALDRFNDANGGRLLRIGHHALSTTQYVGYVQVGKLAIEILPKADRGASRDTPQRWRDALLKMLRASSGMRLKLFAESAQRVVRVSLLDVVAACFLDEVERLLHEGLAKGYRGVEENRSTFRGRLRFADHVRENAARGDRFFVAHATYDHDTTVNGILLLALEVLGHVTLSARLTGRVARCRAAFPEVTKLRTSPGLFERLTLGRTTERYRTGLVLARMILEQTSPALRAGETGVFALLFDMNQLWERYVAALFRRACPPSLVVSTQESRAFWRAGTGRARQVRPDIVVRRRAGDAVALVADTKWKVVADGQPSDDDLRQMFVYNELFGGSKSILIYPRVTNATPRSGEYVGRAHGCESLHLGLFDGALCSTSRLEAEVGHVMGRFASGGR